MSDFVKINFDIDLSKIKILDDSVFETEIINERKESFKKNSGLEKRYLEFNMEKFKYPKFINMLNLARLYYTKIKRGETVNMIVCGSVGTGKTALISALLQEIYLLKKKEINGVKIFYNCRYTLSSDLCKLLNKTQIITDKNYNDSVKKHNLENCDVCVIDEVGKEIGFDTDKILINFLEKRYAKELSTILIANMSQDELFKYLGPTVQSRLNENHNLVVINTANCEDMRIGIETETKIKVVK